MFSILLVEQASLTANITITIQKKFTFYRYGIPSQSQSPSPFFPPRFSPCSVFLIFPLHPLTIANTTKGQTCQVRPETNLLHSPPPLLYKTKPTHPNCLPNHFPSRGHHLPQGGHHRAHPNPPRHALLRHNPDSWVTGRIYLPGRRRKAWVPSFGADEWV